MGVLCLLRKQGSQAPKTVSLAALCPLGPCLPPAPAPGEERLKLPAWGPQEGLRGWPRQADFPVF